MKNIRRGNNNYYNLQLSYKEYWDIDLVRDLRPCFNCDEVVSGDVVGVFNFNEITGECNEILWEDATSINEDLCDIGLTGYDNRFVLNYTGETFNPSGDTTFCLYPISGDNFCYNMQSVTDEFGVDAIKFCGGFLQGFYKLEDYDYQTMPNFYPNGWTKEFWIKREECSGTVVTYTGETTYTIPNPTGETLITEIWETEIISGNTCVSGVTLNSVYPENEGIFYYWGLRAENKFCIFNDWSGMTTCTGVPLNAKVETTTDIGMNPFLYYNRRLICEGENQAQTKVEYKECCEELICNSLAFRVDDNGAIGVRILSTSGECIVSGEDISYTDEPILEEYYSNDNIIEENQWYHVVYRFIPYDKTECQGYRNGLGTLDVYVDGMLKLSIDNFREIIPYALDEDKDKQLGVPYNISVGGGTQGLLEAYPNEMNDITANTIDVCDYTVTIRKPCVFRGISIDGVEYYIPHVTLNEPLIIESWLEMLLPDRYGDITVTNSVVDCKIQIVITLNGITNEIDYFILRGGGVKPCVIQCYQVNPHLGACGYLEENFAGTFDGLISAMRIHDRPLCLQEIRCNYNIEKFKYNKQYARFTCVE